MRLFIYLFHYLLAAERAQHVFPVCAVVIRKSGDTITRRASKEAEINSQSKKLPPRMGRYIDLPNPTILTKSYSFLLMPPSYITSSFCDGSSHFAETCNRISSPFEVSYN